MPPLASYDGAVIGSGPAGSRTAPTLAPLGNRVGPPERDAQPRERGPVEDPHPILSHVLSHWFQDGLSCG